MVKVYSPLLARPVVQGRATGNGGVPVVWGLGGGSGTGVHFQSLVRFRAQSAELTGSALPESTTFSVFFFDVFGLDSVCPAWKCPARKCPARKCPANKSRP